MKPPSEVDAGASQYNLMLEPSIHEGGRVIFVTLSLPLFMTTSGVDSARGLRRYHCAGPDCS